MTTLQKNSPEGADLFWESRVSDSLGVARKVLARLRKEHLTEGADFVRGDNNSVALTPAGLATIERLLKAGESDGQGERALAGKETGGKGPSMDVPAGPPRREKMSIDRVPQNPTLLTCVDERRGVVVMVRVRENTNFIAGMVIEAIESGDGVWQFRNRVPGDEHSVGRLPRNKGRW